MPSPTVGSRCFLFTFKSRGIRVPGCVFLFFLVIAAAPAGAHAQGDFQVWSETTLTFPVFKEKDESGKDVDKLSLLVLGTLRLGQNRLYPVDARVGAGFDLRLNKYLNFSPTYVFRRSEALRDRKEYEHRLRFDVTVGNRWKNFSIRDRSRLEYRVRNSRSDSVRYRNKFTFAVPVRYKDKEIFSPFVAEEWYYDLTAKEFTTNEFNVGITRKLTQNTSTDIYYVRRDFKNGQPSYVNGIAVNLKIRID